MEPTQHINTQTPDGLKPCSVKSRQRTPKNTDHLFVPVCLGFFFHVCCFLYILLFSLVCTNIVQNRNNFMLAPVEQSLQWCSGVWGCQSNWCVSNSPDSNLSGPVAQLGKAWIGLSRTHPIEHPLAHTSSILFCSRQGKNAIVQLDFRVFEMRQSAFSCVPCRTKASLRSGLTERWALTHAGWEFRVWVLGFGV